VLFYDGRSGASTAYFFQPGGGIDARPLEVGPGFRASVGDFDGDGLQDVAWYGPGDQLDAYWFGTPERSFRAAPMPPVGDAWFPVVADVDGDGIDDILWWDAGPQTDVLWVSRPGGPWMTGVEIGGLSQVAMPDFDGDGAVDLLFTGMHDVDGRPTTWALWWMSGLPRPA
jgi:hypothetical protein